MEWSPYHIRDVSSDGGRDHHHQHHHRHTSQSKPPLSHRFSPRRPLPSSGVVGGGGVSGSGSVNLLSGPAGLGHPQQSISAIRSMSMAPLQGSAMTPRDKSMERERRVAAAAAAAEAKYAAEPDARQIHRASIKGKLLTDSRSGTCLPEDKVVFAESPSLPGIPVVYRLPDDRQASPEKLNLDRRELSVCPILEGESHLRLLYFQHNMITRIQHLSSLKRLIFLDFYNNLIEEISGLSSLTSLRVLMLGKNRIHKISNVENLTKLDVLDLHGNMIRSIENLSNLKQLRILNLAGNQITCVENVAGLDSLCDLNLRRNMITEVHEIDALLNIERLYLSYNRIESFDSVRCLASASPSLTELCLDCNPFANDPSYKHILLESIHSLELLDMKEVTNEEHRAASILLKKTEEKKKEEERRSALEERREVAIRNAERKWKSELSRGSFWSSCKPRPLQRTSSETRSRGNSRPSSASGQRLPRPMTQHESRSQSQIGTSTRSNGGGKDNSLFHFSEIEGNWLSFYGIESLGDIDKSWGSQAVAGVTTIAFHYVCFDDIALNLYKLRTKFPGLANLVFHSTNLMAFQQLNALSCLRRLDGIVIESEGNPVVEFQLWKPYILFRLSHLGIKQINGEEVTAKDVVNAEKLFGNISHLSTSKLPQSRLLSLLGDSRRKQVLHAAVTDGDSKRLTLIGAELKRSHGPSVEAIGKVGLQYHQSEALQKKTQTFNFYTELADKSISQLKSDCLLITQLRQHFEDIWKKMVQKMIDSSTTQMADVDIFMQQSLNSL